MRLGVETISVNGTLKDQYKSAVHDKDHTIILNGNPIRTHTCSNEKDGNRIVLNGEPYESYRRDASNANTVFLNGQPYYGGELGYVNSKRWKTAPAGAGRGAASSGTVRDGAPSDAKQVRKASVSYSENPTSMNVNGKVVTEKKDSGPRSSVIWFVLAAIAWIILEIFTEFL